MNNAVITPCSHFFHAGCLKKWLYVQETCPLCHSQLKSQSPTGPAGPNQDSPAANQSPAGQEEAPADGKEKDGAPAVGSGEGEGRTGAPAGEVLGCSPSLQQKTSPSPEPSPSTGVKEWDALSASTRAASSPSDPHPSNHHHLSSVTASSAQPDPACQKNSSSGFLLDSQLAPPAPVCDQLPPVSQEPCPPPSL